MRRKAKAALPRTIGDPRDALNESARAERLALLAANLSRRAAAWAWMDSYVRIREGKVVPPLHRGLTELTLKRISGRLKRPDPDEGEMP